MNNQHWQDRINVLLGLWVFGSPWLLEHILVMDPAAGGGALGLSNLWLVGLAIVLTAGTAVYAFRVWKEWFNLALGVWLLVSPWVLGFNLSTGLMWNAVIFGALIVAFAGWVLIEEQRSKPSLK